MLRGAEEKTHSSSGAEKGITKVLELGSSGHLGEWPLSNRDGLKWLARSIEERLLECMGIAKIHGKGGRRFIPRRQSLIERTQQIPRPTHGGQALSPRRAASGGSELLVARIVAMIHVVAYRRCGTKIPN
jgi:hypothetical protein